MPQVSFVADVFVPKLGVGTGLVIMSFRACALGRAKCCPIIEGYERAFGLEGPTTLSDMHNLTSVLGNDGRRKLTITAPGCARLTADELSIVAMFAAAQADDAAGRDAHLLWLLAKSPGKQVSALVSRIADTFARHGLRIKAPPAVVQTRMPPREALIVQDGGRA